MADPPRPRLAHRKVDSRSIGFLLAGASNVAARWMVDAIWQQPPAVGSADVAGAYIVGIYSHNGHLARRFAQSFGILHAGEDLEDLLQRREVQCVYIGSHPRHHGETVRAALQAGKHVLCEPPLALELDEAEELARMAEHRSLVLGLNYSWRATAIMRRLRDLLADDAIGELLGARIQNTAFLPLEQHTWRLQKPGGGVLWDRTLHDLDLLRFLTGMATGNVYAFNTQTLLGSGVEEDVIASVHLKGGLVVQLHDSFVLPHVPVTVELYGATGTLTARRCHPASKEPELLLTRGDTVRQLDLEEIQPHRAAVGRFIAAVRGNGQPLATAADDRRNLAAVIAMQESLRRRAVMPVTPAQ